MLSINSECICKSSSINALDIAFKQLKNGGFSHIHWCHEWDSCYFYSTYEMLHIQKILRKYNLKLCGVHSPQGIRPIIDGVDMSHSDKVNSKKDYVSFDEYTRSSGVELIKNRIDFASFFNTDILVLHLNVPYKNFKKSKEYYDRFWHQVFKSFDELKEYCQQKKVRIAIENLFDNSYESQFDVYKQLFSRYDRDFIGICYDTGHANMMNKANPFELFDLYPERIIFIHAHDNNGIDDQHKIPYTGGFNWKSFKIHYDMLEQKAQLTLELNYYKNESEEVFIHNAFNSLLSL